MDGKQLHQKRRRKEKTGTGADHQNRLQGDKHGGEPLHALFVIGAVGIARQRGRRRLHSVPRNIKSRLHRVGNGVRRRGYLPQGIDHGSKRHIPKGSPKALQHIREGHPHTGPKDLPVRDKPLSPGRNHGMLPENNGNAQASHCECDGAGNSRPDHPKSRPVYGQVQGKQPYPAGRIDKEKIQCHINQIDQQTDFHGRSGISRRAEHGSENNARRPRQHGQI